MAEKKKMPVSCDTDKTAESVYTKEQIMKSSRYGNRKDLISVLLEDGKEYTTKEIDKQTEEFLKGRVN